MRHRIKFYCIGQTSIVDGVTETYDDAVVVAKSFVALNPQGVAVVQLELPGRELTYCKTLAIEIGHAIAS